jgi:hypothetical protein
LSKDDLVLTFIVDLIILVLGVEGQLSSSHVLGFRLLNVVRVLHKEIVGLVLFLV